MREFRLVGSSDARADTHTDGKIPLVLLLHVLEGNANVQGCGPFTLPSGADLDGAPQKIKDHINALISSDWLNAIRSIDIGDQEEGVVKVQGEGVHTCARTQLASFKHLFTDLGRMTTRPLFQRGNRSALTHTLY